MQQSMTAVLERDTTFDSDFETEPYEVAWATEGRWFVQVLAAGGTEPRLTFTTQVSPDGLTWCDLPEAEHVVDGPGITTWSVSEFGGWLRLRARAEGEDARWTVRIHLALKG